MATTEPQEFRITNLSEIADGVMVLTLDDPDSGANVMNRALQAELEARVAHLEANAGGIHALLVQTAKPRIFIAGADIKYIAATKHFSHDQVVQFCERGQHLYQRFAELPFPTVGLIQGACVGGGLEFALALDWRIAAQHRNTLIGLPEVLLGLIPGWAATARVPRLCGIKTAMRLIGSGKNLNAEAALEAGLVDQLVPDDRLQTAALEFLQDQPDDWYQARRQALQGAATFWSINSEPDMRGREVSEPADLEATAEEVLCRIVEEQPDLHPKAPTTVVRLISRSATADLTAASRMEAEAMATVYTSASGQGLVHAFLLNDRAKKSPGKPRVATSAEVQCLGIVGLGIMGQSIAELLVSAPWNLVLYDRDETKRRTLAKQFSSYGRVQVVDDWEGLSDCDAILENVYEQLEIKVEVLKQLERIVSPSTSLLSNTSVIPISDMAAHLQSPERFGGLHFFNPIRQTRLAEIARHATMSDDVQLVAHQIAKQVGKLSIFVGDGPGLVVNRLLMAMLNEAQHLLAEGHSIPDIDRAATDFGWRLGPFQIMDVIGLSTAFDAGRQIAQQLPDSVNAPPFLRPLIKAKRQGQLGGLGFYRYDGADRELDVGTMKLIDHYIRPTGGPLCGGEMMAARMNAAMVGQASEILQRQQVTSAADIDICTVLALGFPTHRGGLLYWADQYPLARLVEEVRQYRPDYQLPGSLESVIQTNRRFYQQEG